MTSPVGTPEAAGGAPFLAIYTELRERISLLAYPPGTALSENALAQEFGVSRTPIRKVLQRLEFDGLVTVRHGVGTIVEPIDMMYLRQVYALRLKLIDLIADLSSAHVSSEDVETLDELVAGVRELHARRDPRALARLYLRYNEALTRAIGNEPLREITDRLFYQTSRVWLQLLPEMDWREEVDAIVDEIDGVLAALRAQDMRRVSAIRRDHFVRCLHRINRSLSGADATAAPAAKGG
jgi:DNA-binding GntR family transcriptional regulator